jgi:hypothetical protein
MIGGVTHSVPPETAYLREPPDQLGAPPVATRPQLLPIGSLAPMDFERLCYRLAVIDSEVEHCQLYGVSGQAQYGVDSIARQTDGYRVIQCKRRRRQIEVGDLVSAVDDFIAGSWRHRANEFVLAVSSSVEPTVGVTGALHGPVFEPLTNPDFFAQVHVDEELGTVVWPNGADLDPLVLHGDFEPASRFAHH